MARFLFFGEIYTFFWGIKYVIIHRDVGAGLVPALTPDKMPGSWYYPVTGSVDHPMMGGHEARPYMGPWCTRDGAGTRHAHTWVRGVPDDGSRHKAWGPWIIR